MFHHILRAGASHCDFKMSCGESKVNNKGSASSDRPVSPSLTLLPSPHLVTPSRDARCQAGRCVTHHAPPATSFYAASTRSASCC